MSQSANLLSASPPTASAAAKHAPELVGVLPQADPAALVSAHRGPAVYLDAEGGVLASNAASGAIVAQINGAGGRALRRRIADVVYTGEGTMARVQAGSDDEAKSFDLTLLPISAESRIVGVLLLGRDATLDLSLTKALAASRELFKDLVTCSADFSWETDPSGVFTFVSAAGALGHTADKLVGASYRDLIDLESAELDDTPFACREAKSNVEIWLRGADEELACVLVSSVPVFAKSGEWRGARGVCRDVTDLRRQETALRRAQQREVLLRNVVDAIRTEVSPGDMFDTAVRATSRIFDDSDCFVARLNSEAKLLIAATLQRDGFVSHHSDALLSELLRNEDDKAAAASLTVQGARMLAATCDYRDERLGHLCVVRGHEDGAWSEDQEELLARVADHLGIAMAQARVQERLRDLSRTDGLTGLLNRRAFEEELDIRLHNVKRLSRVGALLFIDLDNFKHVNDQRGHAVGDAALRAFAEMLRGSIRAGDLASRLGGDEFALWLEGAQPAGAQAKGQLLLEASQMLACYSGDDALPLTASVGIVGIAPGGDLNVSEVLIRADEVMYRAKKAGKSQTAYADLTPDVRDGNSPC